MCVVLHDHTRHTSMTTAVIKSADPAVIDDDDDDDGSRSHDCFSRVISTASSHPQISENIYREDKQRKNTEKVYTENMGQHVISSTNDFRLYKRI